MANHAYVVGLSRIDLDDVERICRETLGGAGLSDKVQVERAGDDIEIQLAGGSISLWPERDLELNGNTYPLVLTLRHGHMGEWAWWVDTLLLNHLAQRLGGRIADEGVEEVWGPDPAKYATYDGWLARLTSWLRRLGSTTFRIAG